MAANSNVVDELIVKITLDADAYKKADREVDKVASETERKAKTRDRDQQKRMKDSAAAAKQFAGALKSLALTIASVLGVSGGAAGLIGAVVALTNFETNLRRATVSTGLSNREMQAWGSAARRLGADAQAGAQAIADLAKEQKQFNLTGNAPVMQAFARLGIRVSPDTPIQDILSQAQQVYRNATPAQKGQIESGLAASGVSNDLILLIKSEKDVRTEFARSFAESAEENRNAMDNVASAMESLKNAAVSTANVIATILQPAIEQFSQWIGQSVTGLSAFSDRVQMAGGGLDGFFKVLDKESPQLAETLRFLGEALKRMGEAIDVAVYGFQSLYRGLKQLFDWVDAKFGVLAGGGSGQVKEAVKTVGDAVKWGWDNLVGEARRGGAAPIGSLTGEAGGVKLTPGAQQRIAAGELAGRPGVAKPATGTAARPDAQTVMQYLIGQGLNVPQAAAVTSNIQGESNFNPAAVNTAGGGQGARGLFQHRGARIDAFKAKYGVTPDKATWQQQLDFVLTNPYERSLLDRSLAGPGGAAEKGANFSRIFEGHGKLREDARRGEQAQRLAQQFNPATGAQGGSNGNTVNINGPVTVQANNPQEFIGGIQRVSPVQNYNSAVR